MKLRILAVPASDGATSTLSDAGRVVANMTRPSGVLVRRVAGAWRVAVVSVRVRIAAVAVLAIALGGISASSASAYDEVWLNNQTNVAFTQHSLCILVGALQCSEEDGGAWLEGAVLAAGQVNPGISAILQLTGPTPVSFTTTWYPSGSSNYFQVTGVDPPLSPAYITCTGSVPGFDCAVADELYAYLEQDGSSSSLGKGKSSPVEARFWSGLAPVSRVGIASVPVATYSTRRRGTVRELVVLHSNSGTIIGRGEKTMRLGQKAYIEVRLTSGVARKIASGTSVEIHASVAHADGTVGEGQATTMVLTKLTPALRRLLHPPAG